MSCTGSTYCLSNTGNNSINDNYLSGGTHNGNLYYTGITNNLFIYYSSSNDEWCLSTALDGSCIMSGDSPGAPDCPDLSDFYFSTGTCPTPTPSPTSAVDCSTLDFEAIFDCDVIPTPTPTATPTTTPTPTVTPTPTDVCGGTDIIATIESITPTPTPTPTITPTSSSPIVRPCVFSGDVTFNVIDGQIVCPYSFEFQDCFNGAIYLTTTQVSNPSGGSLSEFDIFNSTVNGESRCISFIGINLNEIGGDIINLNSGPIGKSNQGDCIYCEPTITPTPTPTPAVEYFSLFERCNGVPCTESGITFGEQTDPNVIISNWVRFSSFAGVNYPGTTIKSGLQRDGTIITNDPSKYFYTGANSINYLGVYSYVMTEGQNVGPSGATRGQFYYNDYINKFVVWYNVKGVQWQDNANYLWATWDPTKDTGLSYGNPTASRFLTTSTNWSTTPLTITQLTVSGASNTVVTAINKITDAGGVTDMIQCSQNSGLLNGFYSTCGYNEYTHEVTLGSTVNDNDSIGLVLAAFKDNDGIYGPSGQTQSLTLIFNGQNNGSSISFNQSNNTQAFTDGNNYSTMVWNGTPSPFGPGNYNNNGQVRVKIIKTGTTISVHNTNNMGNGPGQSPLGVPNPYTLLVSIDLADDSTWTDAPSYAVGTELLRFTGGTQFGYLTSSQPETQFYDIVFSGSQQTNNDSLYAVGLTTPGANKVSTFNEVTGCWEYISEVTGYTGSIQSLTLDTGYDDCEECLTDVTPTPTPTVTPTVTPTP